MKPYEWMTEAELQEAVADYLRFQYPDVLFHSDFGSSVKMNIRQGARKKRQNGGRRGWPDMFIAEPFIDEGLFEDALCRGRLEHGLFLELKKEGTRLKKKNGEWATEHIAEQAEMLEKLRQRGYCAEFSVGFEEAKRIIDEYLGAPHAKD